jgi:hypothetical protein
VFSATVKREIKKTIGYKNAKMAKIFNS